MPPRIPGFCTLCGKDADLDDLLCPDCDALSRKHQLVEPPIDDEDTQPVPATLCPPRRVPVWLHGRIFTVECDPQDRKAETALAELGYTQTAEMKDPRTGVVTSHVWAKSLDEGC